MDTTRSSAKSTIEKLVHFFEQNIHQFKSPSFNETQARQQLIDPFFEALGWDITNRGMRPLYLQEVIPEGRVKTNIGKEVREQTAMFDAKQTLGKEYKEYASILDYIAEDEYKASVKEATKKPDYRFRIKGQTKFFVEAKKPFVDLSKNQDAIFQVKRYGFSGRVPVSILTDFEQFRVFDCTHKPLYEKPKLGIIKEFDLTCAQYLDEFDHLYDTFSREAVEAGSLDTLTKKLLQKKTGDFALDKTFLDDLSKWREELARDIAKHPRNRRQLNDYTLNESVQRILDRIVFFRVCEDREIEVENTLLAVLQMWKSRPGISLYSLLNELFKQRRTLYNGLLFSPHECEELEVGDDVLLKILQNLNYPFSPYHFNEIGVEILGSIYEKFLGKTIHLAKKNVIVSEKPEVRKAGGVYYTPQYIVNYIVDNTLGKLIYSNPVVSPPTRGRSFDEVETEGVKQLLLSPKQVAKLKIIDIACGSGSFLLGAFQKLIDYHIEWYTQHPKDIQTINNVPDAYNDVSGNLRLSSRKKRDILVNNIYGVDIDRQAVEVTQMSLYLRVLENENADTLNPQMTLALKEVYLPSLAGNIKCGNSLIGTDFGAQGEMFDDGARMKINPFDWEMEFSEIMKSGGFDCVIGNPPYRVMGKEDVSNSEKQYLEQKYQSFQYKADLYHLFIERGIGLLKPKGLLGFITPNTWFTLQFTKNLRHFVLENSLIRKITIFNHQVFDEANVDTAIEVFEKLNKHEMVETNEIVVQILPADFTESLLNDSVGRIEKQGEWMDDPLFRFEFRALSIESRILRNIVKRTKPLSELAKVSLGTQAYNSSKHTKEQIKNRIFHSKKKLGKEYFRELSGGDVGRYSLRWIKKEWIKYGPWLHDYRPMEWLTGPRLLVREITAKGEYKICATYTEETYCNYKTILNIIPAENELYSMKFFLGILNSNLLSWLYPLTSNKIVKDSFPRLSVGDLKQLPIRTLDFAKTEEKKMHDSLVSHVDKMLDLQKQLAKTKFDSEKEPIERQIKATDKKIDQLVYQLYGLTEEEIKVVEGE
jgi:type I restriction-modification system DNA methylase subunit